LLPIEPAARLLINGLEEMNRAERRRTAKLMRNAKPAELTGGFETWKPGMVDMSSPDQLTLAGITVCGPGIGATAREVINQQTRKILAEHGPRAFGAPKTSASIHEAGHVVMHTLQGDQVEWMRFTRRAVACSNEKGPG
jgi:hypothetical protein